MTRSARWLVGMLAAALGFGCAGDTEPTDFGDNPFLEDGSGASGKEDTGYVNLRATEVECTVEADLEASAYQMFNGPGELAQFAVTYLKKEHHVYLEILAEDTTVPDRVEWLVDGEWLNRQEAEAVGVENLRRFRIADANVVLLGSSAENVEVGSTFEATVPIRPYQVMQEAENACADYNSHIDLSQSVYWYLWNPNRGGCELETQTMTLTVEDIFPQNPQSYPEYDRLVEDGRLDVVIVWGKLDDGDVQDDYNWRNVRGIATFLTEAGFEEVEDAPLGRRFVRVVGTLTETVDVYGPDLFHSVADYARFDNWQRAVSEHEVVMYNGHSVLGTGMAFERVEYPDFYQIFQVGSCLSYEYYVRPIIEGKGGWENVDILSNVEPTYYSENLPLTSTVLAKLFWGAENNGEASWQDIMEAVSRRLGHSRFGVSGARDNCFSPDGDRCIEPPPPPPPSGWEGMEEAGTVTRDEEHRFETPSLPAGQYTFQMAGTADADLYVRVGQGPTASEYDCRPYSSTSNETCTIELNTENVIHVMVRGYATSSDYELTGQ